MGDPSNKVISYFVVAGLKKDNQLPLKKTSDPQGFMDNAKDVKHQVNVMAPQHLIYF